MNRAGPSWRHGPQLSTTLRGRAYMLRGTRTRKEVPTAPVSTSTLPPCPSTTWRTVVGPSPNGCHSPR